MIVHHSNSVTTAPAKLLIVLLGAIGDVCRALPLAVRIKRSWPETAIHWAIEPKSVDLVRNHPAVDRVIEFDRPSGFAAYLRFLRTLRAEHYPLVIDLQRHLKSGFTALATGAPRRLGFHRKNAKEGNWLLSTDTIPALDNFLPKIEQYQRFGDLLGIPRLDPLVFDLKPTADAVARLEQLLKSSSVGDLHTLARVGVGLVMGSSWRSRFWPAEHYGVLIDILSNHLGYLPVLIGGKGERHFTDTVREQTRTRDILDFVGRSSLADVVAILANLRFVVAPDSGPAHIAAAVGTPVITLFGATDVRRSAPYGFQEFALRSVIGCSPCYRRECPGLNSLCMREIPVAAVCAQIEALTKHDKASMDTVIFLSSQGNREGEKHT